MAAIGSNFRVGCLGHRPRLRKREVGNGREKNLFQREASSEDRGRGLGGLDGMLRLACNERFLGTRGEKKKRRWGPYQFAKEIEDGLHRRLIESKSGAFWLGLVVWCLGAGLIGGGFMLFWKARYRVDYEGNVIEVRAKLAAKTTVCRW